MLSCVAIAQRRPRRTYARELGWENNEPSQGRRARRDTSFDIRPGQEAWLMSLAADGQQRMAQVRWGYTAPAGATAMGLSARITKATNGRYPTLWRYGRAVLPADCWYLEPESGDAARCVRAAAPGAMFIAAISNFWMSEEGTSAAGFLIVTGEPGDGVGEARDREPLVLRAEDAHLWLDPHLSVDQAQRLATGVALTHDAFVVEADTPPIAPAAGEVLRPGLRLKS
jgi:putative SOS response-associated peptidase YedK